MVFLVSMCLILLTTILVQANSEEPTDPGLGPVTQTAE